MKIEFEKERKKQKKLAEAVRIQDMTIRTMEATKMIQAKLDHQRRQSREDTETTKAMNLKETKVPKMMIATKATQTKEARAKKMQESPETMRIAKIATNQTRATPATKTTKNPQMNTVTATIPKKEMTAIDTTTKNNDNKIHKGRQNEDDNSGKNKGRKHNTSNNTANGQPQECSSRDS